MVLVVAKDDTRVDLKALAKRLGLGRFSFGKRGAARSRARRAGRLGYAVRAHQRQRAEASSSWSIRR